MQKEPLAHLNEKIGTTGTATGWVHNTRLHSKVAFIDLRDSSGILQVVVTGKLLERVKELGHECLISVDGEVVERDEKQKNPESPTGSIELQAKDFSIISPSKIPPFPVNEDTKDVNETIRLAHRYLDLRTERMRKNLERRAAANRFFHNHFAGEGFLEVETPQLTKGTPEGAREFLVPSRLYPGSGYVLPQSPQQYKQLLMVSGVNKYYQIARCFRDEDQRQDRQPEFSQLDIEMAFVEQEDVLAVIERAIIALVQEIFPELSIKETPFPRLSYSDAMAQYGTDKPDLRSEEEKSDSSRLAFGWIVDFPMFEKETATGALTAAHHPFTLPQDTDLDKSEEELLQIPAFSYDLVLNGYELGSGSIRIHDQELQDKVFQVLGLPADEISARFGHLLEAFSYGVPPHGGFAVGLDRLYAVLNQQETIREVIAFPKTGEAKDPLTGAPTEMSERALSELHLKTTPKEE